jgi:hypothetical protein
MIRPSGQRAGFRGLRALVGLGLVLLGFGWGCAEVESDGIPMVTIEQCHSLGGAPLFDPDDGRPVEESCPDGLYFLGEFSEPFFGSDGGLCCGGREPAELGPGSLGALSTEGTRSAEGTRARLPGNG